MGDFKAPSPSLPPVSPFSPVVAPPPQVQGCFQTPQQPGFLETMNPGLVVFQG